MQRRMNLGWKTRYRVALQESEEGFSVWVPGLPGCASQGTTEEEALANLAAAVREYLEVERQLSARPLPAWYVRRRVRT